ncbi:antibiotic biosynthesis monooxygenase [Rhodobacteraceae bacterium]|nr:antibiotic biosynthesis monooxygenase [Paracoccaceae bacterium]
MSGRLICASSQDVETVYIHLPEHIRRTREEPGCITFDVVPTDDPMIWRVAECFRDADAFKFHQHRTRGSTWWSATANIQRDFKVTGLE